MKRFALLFVVACGSSAAPAPGVVATAQPAAPVPSAPSPQPAAALPTFDGSLPAPIRAHVVASKPDGTLLVHCVGARPATDRDRARVNNTPMAMAASVAKVAAVTYHAVVEPTRGCVVDTLETPALDDLAASFARLGPRANQVVPAVRAELDRLFAVATQFGTRTLPDRPLAFGTTADRAVFEESSFVYVVDGTKLVSFGPGAAVGPAASPNGTTLVAGACNPRCGDYLMQWIGGAPGTPTKPTVGPKKRASDFWFRDDDHLVYLQNDGRSEQAATKICLHEYVVSTKQDRELKCLAGQESDGMLAVSPGGEMVALHLDHVRSAETKVLRVSDWSEVWTLPQTAPYQYVDDQGKLTWDDGVGEVRTTHVASAKGDDTTPNVATAGFSRRGVVLLHPAGTEYGVPSGTTLETARCNAFTLSK